MTPFCADRIEVYDKRKTGGAPREERSGRFPTDGYDTFRSHLFWAEIIIPHLADFGRGLLIFFYKIAPGRILLLPGAFVGTF